jgi:nicotinate phosphoribosyltransferase
MPCPWLVPVMRGGRRRGAPPAFSDVRAHARREIEQLPAHLKQLEAYATYLVQIADKLLCLADAVDRRFAIADVNAADRVAAQ